MSAAGPVRAGDAKPPLFGRDRELAALGDALAAVLAGRGALMLVSGKAGIGKTALAEALLAEARDRGTLVLVGRCYDLAETPPYGPWRELFERAPDDAGLPALPQAVLPPDRQGESLAGQDGIVRRTVAYLAALAGRTPLVLLLEDLHWADQASLDLLRVAARGLAEIPILLLATYRDDELPRGHQLATLLPALVREARAERLDIPPLDAAAIGTLVEARYGLAAQDQDRLVGYLHRRTEGNALFLGELLRTLESAGALRRAGDAWALGDLDGVPVPPLLRQVIAGRLARLGDADRWLLAVAAALGQEPPFDLWAAVAEVGERALLAAAERAVAARVLEPTEGGVRFAHALIREALYDGVLAPRRREWHRHAAEFLLAAPQRDPDAVADHFRRADDPRAFDWLLRAGLHAHRVSAWLTAAERFTAAAALLDGDETRARERGWLLFSCGRLYLFTDPARAIRALDEAEPLALAAGDRVLSAYIRFMRGNWRCLLGQVRLGLAGMARDIAALDALAPIYHSRASQSVAMATIEGFLSEEGDRLSALPRPVEPSPGSMNRINLIHWLANAGHYREALAMGEPFLSAVSAALGEDHLHSSAPAYLGVGQAHAALGHPDEARRAFDNARVGLAAHGDLFMIEYSLWYEILLVFLPYQATMFAERMRAVSDATSVWARATEVQTRSTHAAPTALPAAIVAGRWGEARQLAEAALDAATPGHRQGATAMLAALARHQGDTDLAWAQMRALHPDGPATEPGNCHFQHGIALQAVLADLALDEGDLDAAGAWIAAHGRWLDWSGATLWRADHLLLRARHARQAGDHIAACGHAQAALAQAGEPRQPLAQLAAHRLRGELAADAGQYAVAGEHLAAALALADACAAPYERALALLALAELHLATGAHDSARAALAEARAILEPLKARPALARAAALAATLAAPPPPPAPPAGLSPREAEVLALLAAGRSTAQIAQALFLSPRTVERHIANIYPKIAARNRAEAAAFALRHHLA